MKKWIRWSYVLPRLAVVAAILLLIVLGATPAARFILVRSGQGLTGAKVDFDGVQLSLLNGTMELDDAQFADPRDEFKNLAQFDHAHLKLDMTALTHKRLVVESGVMEGVRFGTSRSESGALATPPVDPADEARRERTRQWLKKLAGMLGEQIINELESVQTARDLSRKWPAEYRQWERRAESFEKRIDTLQEIVRTVRNSGSSTNPAQRLMDLQKILSETKGLADEISVAKNELLQIKQRVADDKERVKYAVLRDRGRVEESLRLTALQSEDIAEYLLGDQYAGYTMEALRWIQWAKKYLEMAGEPPEVDRSGGENIWFTGLRREPSLIIRRVGLDGYADIDGQPTRFTGTLADLTSSPKLHDRPTVLQLSLDAENPSQVRLVSDRRQELPRQELTVNTTLRATKRRTLGDVDSLALEYSATRGRAWFQAGLVDGKVDGRFIIQQEGVALSPVVDAKLGGEQLRRPLAAGISGVDHIHVLVRLTGDVRHPEVQVETNVGRELSAGINQAVRSELADHQERLLQKAEFAATQELLQLDAIIEKKQSELASRFGDQIKVLSELTGIKDLGVSGIQDLQRPLLSSLPVNEEVRERLKKFDFRSLR